MTIVSLFPWLRPVIFLHIQVPPHSRTNRCTGSMLFACFRSLMGHGPTELMLQHISLIMFCMLCIIRKKTFNGIFCWKSFQAVISWFCVSQCINFSTRTRLVVGNLKVSVVKKFGPFTERLMSSPETLGQTAELIKIWLWIINWSKLAISSTCLLFGNLIYLRIPGCW